MKNILKKLILPLMSIPIVTAPLTVVACDLNFDLNAGDHTFANDVDVTDLGFVEDLSTETIVKAFIEKNPRVVGGVEAIATIISGGNSHKAVIQSSNDPPYKFTSGFVWVTYWSKLEYGDGNQTTYRMSKENNQITINFNILDDSYDWAVDPKISCVSAASAYQQPPYQWTTFEHRIDKEAGVYQIIISLDKLVANAPAWQRLGRYFMMDFRQGDESWAWNRKLGITLGSINIAVH